MRKRKGFTLIELIVVVAIIGILLTLGLLTWQDFTKGSREATFEANHRIVAAAVALYLSDNNGVLPQTLDQVKNYINPEFEDGAPPEASYDVVNGKVISVYPLYRGGGKTLEFTP